MKVYIVTSGCYSDYHIDAVLETRKQAEAYCALHPSEDQEIEEWETAEYAVECDKPVYRKWVGIIQENGVLTVRDEGYSFKNVFEVKNVPRNYYHNPHKRIDMTTSTDKTVEQAKKILLDKMAALKYEQEMGLEFK